MKGISQNRTRKLEKKLGEFEMESFVKISFPSLGHINPADQCSKDKLRSLRTYLKVTFHLPTLTMLMSHHLTVKFVCLKDSYFLFFW